MTTTHRLTLGALLLAMACVSTPPVTAPPPVTHEQKLAWILQLEDRRLLREDAPAPLPAPVAVPRRRGDAPPPPAPPVPDLTRLLRDDEARIRRRAALAVGRVGLVEGVAALTPLLADPEVEVRQMAVFALGLIGDASAVEALRPLLDDAEPVVQGRAAEALGLIGDAGSADAVGAMVRRHVAAGALASLGADEQEYPLAPPVEAVRLGLYALARLKAGAALRAAVLDANGQPVSRWWPVAFALRRVEDPAAVPALKALAAADGVYTRAFAARGLGVLKDASSFDLLRGLAADVARQPSVAVEAVRALALIGDPRTAEVMGQVLRVPDVDPGIRAEAVRALGTVGGGDAQELLLDLLSDREPAVRGAALGALAQADRGFFLTVLSGYAPDPHWSVRAAVATALGTQPPAVAVPLLLPMLNDQDQRVVSAALRAVAAVKAPNAATMLLERLQAADPVVRASAASALGELRPDGAAAALAEAFRFAERDATYVARAAALDALVKVDAAAAAPMLEQALADKDWAMRVRAQALLKDLDPARDVAAAIRPAPTRWGPDVYTSPDVVSPSVSTHVYIDTDKGTIQIELGVLDAPLTVHSFVTLARQGFFNGVAIHRVVPNFVVQDGDPRGDGEGGPGYTLRDELNPRPYLRGTVGMALDWRDTGGSQFFITHSPQPHLDARYTVFGQVIGGMDVVDRLAQWDIIRRVRVWDGRP